MSQKPVHLCVGVYGAVEDARNDLVDLKKLHQEGLAKHYDAMLVTRDADGNPQVVEKKHAGHPIITGAGFGILLTVLAPVVVIPFGLLGAGAGAVVAHGRPGVSKDDAGQLAEALAAGEAALVVASDASMQERIAQVFPRADHRVARTLDKDELADALRHAGDQG